MYAVNNFVDIETEINLKSAAAASSTVIAASAIQMTIPVVNADGRSFSIASTMNGSSFENILVLVAVSNGSDKIFTVPTARFSSNIVITASDLGLSSPLIIESGMVVFTDTTSNGIGFVQFEN